jgi:hypothetical protein
VEEVEEDRLTTDGNKTEEEVAGTLGFTTGEGKEEKEVVEPGPPVTIGLSEGTIEIEEEEAVVEPELFAINLDVFERPKQSSHCFGQSHC